MATWYSYRRLWPVVPGRRKPGHSGPGLPGMVGVSFSGYALNSLFVIIHILVGCDWFE